MKKIAMCFGAFDGLHAGHEDFFRQAKDMADELIVVLACDTTIVEITGDLPRNNEEHRVNCVGEHPLVDEARLGYLDDKYRVIEEVKPDVICLGHDQEVFTENLDAEMARRGLSATVVRCEAFSPEIYKINYVDRDREEEQSFHDAEYEERGLPL